ncbi:MAG: 4Fe-4S dicluster domain-containing protein [Bacillota bacterium]|nr:4Fe-4S dicluster domain-containing protein [Bacillota bacterium]
MNAYKLPEDHLSPFLLRLGSQAEVYAPERQASGEVIFARLTDPARVVTEYTRTTLPLKKFFSLPSEVMFRFSVDRGYEVPEEIASVHRRVIFGAHACDLHALQILDRTFLHDQPDPYYAQRRESTALIGLSCTPDELCFCNSFGTGFVSDGYDLFFAAVPGGFFVQIGTTRGNDLIGMAKDLFAPADEADLLAYRRYLKEHNGKFTREVTTSALPGILELETGSALWGEAADRCLGCGSCSMVCPTCYCFSVSDRLDLSLKTGERRRTWDSCLFKEYATVAGGHNFRPGRDARLRQRLFHKFVDFPARFERYACVGCGRCTAACPAGIDFVALIKDLRREASA